MRRATAARQAQLFLHGRPELAAAVGAAGLHLPADSDPPPDWEGALSLAAHNRRELVHAGVVGADFALLSPVFPTRSHPGSTTLGVAGFRHLAQGSPVPVLALGGITPANAAEVQTAGASGVACMDAVLAADRPEEAVAAFLAAL